ncbi:MAG: YHYH protein [Ignavibacteria bacterium]|nr:YHYH protein [Ignavibacteria bacterium]
MQYSKDYSYVRCNGIPSYVIGPYRDGNPAQAVGRNYLFKLPLVPKVQTGTKTTVGLGHIGVLINGVPIYNYADARSYNNANIWHQNAIHFERTGFDCATGHPAPLQTGPPGPGGGGGTLGQYHHHQNPTAFNIAKVKMSDVCDMYLADGLYVPDATKHGPLIGFCFDGYPIYGVYGWEDGTKNVKRMKPSYRLRNITERTTLANGQVLTQQQYGPTLAAQPLGAYAEDFEFVAGSGDLDDHNGRFCVTPEYPNGTYAYFATIDENGVSAYPYMIGPTYYGVVITENFGSRTPGAGSTGVTITETVTTYTPNTSVPAVTFSTQAVMAGKEGTPYLYNAKAQATVNEPISYVLESAPTGMVVDAASGAVSWAAPTVGRHNVSLVAKITSGGKEYSAKQTYFLTIASNTPVKITFTSQPVTIGYEGKPYSYTVKAAVSDTSKRLVYRFKDSVDGMTLARQTGIITWQKPIAGTYPITIRAVVAGDTIRAEQSFTLVIKPDTTTSVAEQDSPLSTTTVYPNPANDVLVIQITTPLMTSANVELVDMAGRIIQRATIYQGSTMCFMDVQTVYAGAYVVRITHENNSISYPVVIGE